MRDWYVPHNPDGMDISRKYVTWVRFVTKFARMDIGNICPELLISGIVEQRRTK